ncbi:hypothetical protein PISS_a1981 [Pseudoalteromonas issachenkonii]|uniref:Uncharacterized protein n=1 Tax=Pseudoalteromonas issachenkonii TaxID=152297 RepID=A0ABN5C1C2_9GAMM|nr:hypothetical protein PISS_a1981 [Pseudoalteromonas issachenkonii]
MSIINCSFFTLLGAITISFSFAGLEFLLGFDEGLSGTDYG